MGNWKKGMLIQMGPQVQRSRERWPVGLEHSEGKGKVLQDDDRKIHRARSGKPDLLVGQITNF